MSDEAINDDIVDEEAGEPVISDEEKEALLEGIESGAIEVQTNSGPRYAEVKDFELSSRAYIVTNSYPRLELLNTQLSTLMSKRAEKLLNVPTRVYPGAIEHQEFGQLLEAQNRVSLMLGFTAAPLEGRAFVHLGAGLVAQLVECFFGGSSDEPATQSTNFFTAGEKAVAQKFTAELLTAIEETWEKLTAIRPQFAEVHLSSDLIEGLDAGTPLICSSFDFTVNESQEAFRLLWPVDMISGLIPALKDQKRDVDPAKDAQWRKLISGGVTQTSVPLSCEVGRTTMSLRDIVELKPGDIIPIDNPRKSTIFARGVPVMSALFGVHGGRHAVEATHWVTAHSAEHSE